MSENKPFIRKVMYLCGIAVLLIPLYQLGHPPVKNQAGGQLSQLRAEHGIAQANLGEIDPASETIKLATLGMRGVAANLLWFKAMEFKRTKNWEGVSATTNTMLKLQPNFTSVWEFQSHNLAYNISVEFDDYTHRYNWVRRGIEFLHNGVKANQNSARLVRWTGWVNGHKIGRADEHIQFRKLFSDDIDFHQNIDNVKIKDVPWIHVDSARRIYDNKPDNWLISYLWYNQAENLLNSGVPLRDSRKTPVLFYSSGPMALINFASTTQKDGYFEAALYAWRKAADAFNEYGDREMPTSYGMTFRLNDQEALEQEIVELTDLLENELAPGVLDKVAQEKVDALSDEERAVLEADPTTLKDEQYITLTSAQNKTKIESYEIAERAPQNVREKAKRVALRILEKQRTIKRINQQRGIVHFVYWKTRCNVEKNSETVAARKAVHEADAMYRRIELEEAREKYEEAWKLFAVIYNEHPILQEDVTSTDVLDSVKRYLRLLENLDADQIPPPDFPLMDLIKYHRVDFPDIKFDQSPTPAGEPTPAAPTEAAAENSADDGSSDSTETSESPSDSDAAEDSSGHKPNPESNSSDEPADSETPASDPSGAESADVTSSEDTASDANDGDPAKTDAPTDESSASEAPTSESPASGDDSQDASAETNETTAGSEDSE